MHLVIYYEPNKLDLANAGVPFSGGAGALWKHRTLDRQPDTLTYEIRKLRTPACAAPLPPESKVLALGSAALAYLTNSDSLDRDRGYCLSYQGHPLIATYAPIDCWEFRSSAEEDEDDNDAEGLQDKDVGATRRQNYLFWSIADFNKLLREWKAPPTYRCALWPDLPSIKRWFGERRNKASIVIDIETRRQDHSLDCVGFADAGDHTSIVIPFYKWDNTLAYPPVVVAMIWREIYFFLLRKDITFIAHKADFDFAILCAKYCLPLPYRLHDTLVTMQRQFPFTEKSLSHAISFYTYHKENHKNRIVPNVSNANFLQLLNYNAEDVHRTADVFRAQLELPNNDLYRCLDDKFKYEIDDAVHANMEIGNRLQRTTLLMSLTGMNVNIPALELAKAKLKFEADQWLRIIRILAGIPNFNPNSSDQCRAYFYMRLHYPIEVFTPTGEPSMDVNALYKMQVKQPNPLIPLIIKYRETMKQFSMMNTVLYEPMKL